MSDKKIADQQQEHEENTHKTIQNEASTETPSKGKESIKKSEHISISQEDSLDDEKSNIEELSNIHEDIPEEEEEEEMQSSDDIGFEEEEEDVDEIDFSDLTEKELLKTFREYVNTKPIPTIKDTVYALRTEFNKRFDDDLKEQKEAFIADGGNIIDFHYTTPAKKEFNSILFDYREKRNNYYKNLKRDLQANLKKREEIIEELKGLLNVEESIHTTYQNFKRLQDQWHTAGAIPRDAYNLTWNTYRHHVENFYDFLHLNREFRDLDFKHNLDQKLKLIARAEELAQQKYTHKAFRELQMLHKMWKEDIGPVAKEYREDIWDKFSEATKVIHEKRQDFFKEEEILLEANFDKKLEVIQAIQSITEKTKPNHNSWQQAIKKVQEQRDIFFGIGRVPKTKNKEIWNTFKDATRNFNKTKNSFYKNQKKEQFENLEIKLKLIQIAEEHKDSEDFEMVTPLMKRIQSDWKNTGHVPRKQSDKIWKQFKNACNHYFDRLYSEKDKASSEEVENYDKKITLLKSIENYKLTDDKTADMQQINEFMETWNEIGRVPKNKRQIDKKFNKVLDGIFKKLNVSKSETELLKYNNKLHSLAAQNDKERLRNEHFFISKKVEESKDEIRQLENNLGFFQNADKTNPLYQDVVNKINQHKEKLKVWKAKLKQIREIRDY